MHAKSKQSPHPNHYYLDSYQDNKYAGQSPKAYKTPETLEKTTLQSAEVGKPQRHHECCNMLDHTKGTNPMAMLTVLSPPPGAAQAAAFLCLGRAPLSGTRARLRHARCHGAPVCKAPDAAGCGDGDAQQRDHQASRDGRHENEFFKPAHWSPRAAQRPHCAD